MIYACRYIIFFIKFLYHQRTFMFDVYQNSEELKIMVITIDGPTASGKGSAARLLAGRLNIYYLETGLLYRALAYVLLTIYKKDVTDFSALTIEDLNVIHDLRYEYHDGRPAIFYKTTNIAAHLNNPMNDAPASIISAQKIVRDALLPLQQNCALTYDLVADGRDCGSVVFPHAAYKFFLTASLEVRAERVMQDPRRRNFYSSLEGAKEELQARDERDQTRAVAPLRIPDNAIIIDSSTMTISEVVDTMMSYIKTD